VAMSIFVGSKYEYQTIVNLGKLVNEAEKYGIPVLAVTAVGKELGKDARYLSLACRMAAEQGAHIVKTYYCENFEKVVQSCPVPIIVAGGKKIPERDALQLTYNSIKAGAVGVDIGRNVWQSEHPVAMIRAVRSIVHGNSNVDQAFKLYQKLASGDSKNKQKSKGKKPMEIAVLVGSQLAKKALDNKVDKVVFDRAYYKFHGRVKALADAAREAGLKF
ncbi:hypothetical protein HOB30_04865, partial [Candidatus Falkowbacteria bacterium]|nr:hypothetical protein [Candidatus Falkowbacteria bacterium]